MIKKELKAISIHEVYDALYARNERIFENDKYYLDVLGSITFGYINGAIQFFQKPLHPGLKDIAGRICGDLMTGREFYECVDDGGIINYDGTLGNIYIDSYRANLGLAHKDFCQDNFLVDGETWLDICDNNEVLVEWCNK